MNSASHNSQIAAQKLGEAAVRRHSSASSFVACCLAGGLIQMACTWQNPAESVIHSVATPAAAPVDLNAADWTSFSQLKGIGPTLGFRIVANRQQFGPFLSIDDLLRVEGIGPLTLDRIRYRLTIGHDQLKPSKQ